MFSVLAHDVTWAAVRDSSKSFTPTSSAASLIISSRVTLKSTEPEVAIYGWFLLNLKVIEPVPKLPPLAMVGVSGSLMKKK